MTAGLLRWIRKSPVVGGGASVALHLALFATLALMGSPWVTYSVKRGEPLFIELPDIDEPAPAGNPAAKEPGPPGPLAPPAKTAKPPAPPKPPLRQAPKPPVAPAAPVERTVSPEKPAAETSRVASAPPVVKREPAPPAPKPDVGPPASRPEAAPPAPKPDVRAPEPVRRPEPAANPAVAKAPEPPAKDPDRAETPGSARVAVVPTPREPAPDIRSALRRGGGGGGRDDGRGGIEGEPIPLDSKDPKYSDYLDRVRRMIKDKWSYPCVKNPVTHECEYKSGQLAIEFGIAKDGRVPFVTVRQSSGYIIMDDYAANAIKLASPFPPVPDVLSRKGIPILASFHYVVETSLVNLLR